MKYGLVDKSIIQSNVSTTERQYMEERGVIADRVVPGFNLLRPGVVQRDWPASS